MKTEFLVGNTGFVGSNLALQHKFTGLFHSSNIADAFGKSPDLLVYAGVRAEMFLANKEPNKDKEIIKNAIENIKRIRPRKLILISTVAVYPQTKNVDEDTPIDYSKLTAYGQNRYLLEQWSEENIEDHLIIRLPAIYGVNLKKNFLYDYIHRIPVLLTEQKFLEFSQKENILQRYYENQGNGFYKYHFVSGQEEDELKKCFNRLGFSALNFTDSRSVYQFYSLKNLWKDISLSCQAKIKKVNLVTPPIKISDLYWYLDGKVFNNKLNKTPFDYDIRTKYSEQFGGSGGYIMERRQTMAEICEFIHEEQQRKGIKE